MTSTRGTGTSVDDFGVPALVVRGYGSQSYAVVVTRRVATDPRPAVLLHLGDLDASGEDICSRSALGTAVVRWQDRLTTTTWTHAGRVRPAPSSGTRTCPVPDAG